MTITKYQEEQINNFWDFMQKNKKELEEYNFIISKEIPYTLRIGNDCIFSTAIVAALSYKTKRHNVVIAYSENHGFLYWCGDSFLEGTLKNYNEYVEKTIFWAEKHTVSEELKDKIRFYYGEYTKSTYCNFWKTKEKICKHIKHVFFLLDKEKITELVDKYNFYKEEEGLGVKIQSSDKNFSENLLMKKVNLYSFKKPVLLMGKKGTGKTYTIDKWCKEKEMPTVFLGGHEGIEAVDMLGMLVRYSSKEEREDYIKVGNQYRKVVKADYSERLIWKDGPLTEAFRKAKAQKVVLFIDEILRIPQRELNILVAALTPDSSGKLRLRTGRILNVVDDIGEEEVLEVPKENIWVVATTNIGGGYAVDEIDLALKDRFRIIMIDDERELIKAVLTNRIADKGFSANLVTKLLEFYDRVFKMKQQENLNDTVNIRHLVEVIELAEKEEDIKELLLDLIPNIASVNIDGELEEVQVEMLKETIKDIFK